MKKDASLLRIFPLKCLLLLAGFGILMSCNDGIESNTSSGKDAPAISNATQYNEDNLPSYEGEPVISSISPSSAFYGEKSFTLNVFGSDFQNDSVIFWNGIPKKTTCLSSASLSAKITSSDIAASGTALVSVANGTGRRSDDISFTIKGYGGTSAAFVRMLALSSNDIAGDSVNNIYASVPSKSSLYPNHIAVIDPISAKIISARFAGQEPGTLAVSDDNQFLYAGLNGSAGIQRFLLPSLSPDIQISLGSHVYYGPFYAMDIAAAPSYPHTIAVSLGCRGINPAAEGGLVIYDDAIIRPCSVPGSLSEKGCLINTIQWGRDSSTIFAGNNETSDYDFYSISVNGYGAAVSSEFKGLIGGLRYRIHFDTSTGYVYADGGNVIDTASGSTVGVFPAAGRMIMDSSKGKAFFIAKGYGQNSNNFILSSYDINQYALIDTVVISGVKGFPKRLILWGSDGLAFNTSGGQIFFIQGTFVKAISSVQ